MTLVKIEYEAMEILRISAYALPKKEVTGILIGTILKYDSPIFIVQNAMPIQEAERTDLYVEPNSKEFMRVQAVSPLIGGYHTHVATPDDKHSLGKLALSKADKKYIRKHYPNSIEILIALNPIKHPFKYKLEQKTLHACFVDSIRDKNYSFELSAYYLNGKRHLRADLDISKEVLKSQFLS